MEMQGKRPQDLVRLALSVHRSGQADVEAPNRCSHRPGAPLRPVLTQPWALAQDFGYFLQLAQGFGLHQLDCEPVGKHPLQLALVAPQGPDRRRVIQPHAPLLDGLGRPERLAAHSLRLQCQGHRVNRLGRRVQQQAGDVKHAPFVFEDGLTAFEGELPKAQAPAQGIPVLDLLFVVRG